MSVRLSVTDPADGGRVVYDRSTRVTLRKVTPNGEGASWGAYGTQWLPETVIIAWSWMLAEK
ncbi:hypothetical protein [Streptomyces sp. NPDC058486]|uniref:hypothetical protein n=1 Tax=unclassified Streptomyces TaxID=2593676 RepID=UPI0036583191